MGNQHSNLGRLTLQALLATTRILSEQADQNSKPGSVIFRGGSCYNASGQHNAVGHGQEKTEPPLSTAAEVGKGWRLPESSRESRGTNARG